MIFCNIIHGDKKYRKISGAVFTKTVYLRAASGSRFCFLRISVHVYFFEVSMRFQSKNLRGRLPDDTIFQAYVALKKPLCRIRGSFL